MKRNVIAFGLWFVGLIGSTTANAQDPIMPDWSWPERVGITILGEFAEYTRWALSPFTNGYSTWSSSDDAKFLLGRVYQDYSTGRTWVFLRNGEALLGMPSEGNPIGRKPYVATSDQWHEIDPYYIGSTSIGDARFVKRDPNWVVHEELIYDGDTTKPLVSERLQRTFNQVYDSSRPYGMVGVGPLVLARKVLGLSTDQVNLTVGYEGRVYSIDPATKRSYTVTSSAPRWQSAEWSETLLGFLVHDGRLLLLTEQPKTGFFGSASRKLYVLDQSKWVQVTYDKGLKVVATQKMLAVKLASGSLWRVTALPTAGTKAKYERIDCCWEDGLVDDVYVDFKKDSLVAEEDGFMFNITETRSSPEVTEERYPEPREKSRTFDFMPGTMATCRHEQDGQYLFIELMAEDMIYHYDPADDSGEELRGHLDVESVEGNRYTYRDDIYDEKTVAIEILSQDAETKTMRIKSFGGSPLDGVEISCEIN